MKPNAGHAKTRSHPERTALAPLNVNVDQAAAMLGFGRVLVYNLLNSGEIASLKVGSRRLVPVAELDAFIARRSVRGPINPVKDVQA